MQLVLGVKMLTGCNQQGPSIRGVGIGQAGRVRGSLFLGRVGSVAGG